MEIEQDVCIFGILLNSSAFVGGFSITLLLYKPTKAGMIKVMVFLVPSKVQYPLLIDLLDKAAIVITGPLGRSTLWGSTALSRGNNEKKK
jgi:hypothetical protein